MMMNYKNDLYFDNTIPARFICELILTIFMLNMIDGRKILIF